MVSGYSMGQMVKFKGGEYGYITYPYGKNGEDMVSIVGLGKKNSFPMLSKDIVEVIDQESYLSKFHKNDYILWCNPEANKFYYSMPAEYELNGEVIAKGPNVYFKYRLVIETGELEYLDRVDVSYCYQLDKLVLLGRSKNEQSVTNLFTLINSFRKNILNNKIEHQFFDQPLLKQLDIYFGEESYYALV